MSASIPGIEHFQACCIKITHVARDQCQLIDLRRCCNESINGRHGLAGRFSVSGENTTFYNYIRIDKDDLALETGQQIFFESGVLFSFPAGFGEFFNAFDDFVDCEGAEVNIVRVK